MAGHNIVLNWQSRNLRASVEPNAEIEWPGESKVVLLYRNPVLCEMPRTVIYHCEEHLMLDEKRMLINCGIRN